MKLSSPIYLLKSQAKKLKKDQCLTMTQALDIVANAQGFNSWSLLIAKNERELPSKYTNILNYFNERDLIIIASRPGVGKTSFSLGLLTLHAKTNSNKIFYYSLAEAKRDISKVLEHYQESNQENVLSMNYSNNICADYIIQNLGEQDLKGAVILIDYLQLLDEKKDNASLQDQVEKLKAFANDRSCIMIFLSQVDREIENRINQTPCSKDIRLPNPLDLNLINKIIFLRPFVDNQNKIEVIFTGRTNHCFIVKKNIPYNFFYD